MARKKTEAKEPTATDMLGFVEGADGVLDFVDPSHVVEYIRARFFIRAIPGSPLITNKWSEKAIKMIEDKHAGKAAKQKEARVPVEEYEASRYVYINEKGKEEGYGLPACAFKSALVAACRLIDDKKKFSMAHMKQAIHVIGTDGKTGPDAMVQIMADDFTGPRDSEFRRDMVRLKDKTATPRYRAMFQDWGTVLTIEFEKDAFTPVQIAQLITKAGRGCGVGEWRPSAPDSMNGSCGMFELVALKDKR
jgi:hypothetical protein